MLEIPILTREQRDKIWVSGAGTLEAICEAQRDDTIKWIWAELQADLESGELKKSDGVVYYQFHIPKEDWLEFEKLALKETSRG